MAFDSGQYACHHHSSNGQFGSVQFLKVCSTEFSMIPVGARLQQRRAQVLNRLRSHSCSHCGPPSHGLGKLYVQHLAGATNLTGNAQIKAWRTGYRNGTKCCQCSRKLASVERSPRCFCLQWYTFINQCMNQILETCLLQLGKRKCFADTEMPHCLGTNFLRHETRLFLLSRAGPVVRSRLAQM